MNFQSYSISTPMSWCFCQSMFDLFMSVYSTSQLLCAETSLGSDREGKLFWDETICCSFGICLGCDCAGCPRHIAPLRLHQPLLQPLLPQLALTAQQLVNPSMNYSCNELNLRKVLKCYQQNLVLLRTFKITPLINAVKVK